MSQNSKRNRILIAGNWKMNPITREEAKRIAKSVKSVASKLDKTDVVMCPPFTYISSIVPSRSGVAGGNVYYGAQDTYTEIQGSFTGEVSAEILKELGCSYVIVGHSERRKMGETDTIVSAKASAVLRAGMKPIVCVGEEVRDSQGGYLDIVSAQVKSSLESITDRRLASKLVIAYEPIWAIGAKEAMAPASIQEMTIFIRKTLADIYGQEVAVVVPILYGGAVNGRNAQDIVVQGEVDGLLVGRESVNPPGFKELLKAVDLRK